MSEWKPNEIMREPPRVVLQSEFLPMDNPPSLEELFANAAAIDDALGDRRPTGPTRRL